MTYTIRVNDLPKKFYGYDNDDYDNDDYDNGRPWINRTVRAILSDDDALVALYEDAGYNNDDGNGLEYISVTNEDKANFIRGLDVIEELSSDYYPIMNYAHVLQQRPTDKEILEIHENAPNIVVIEDDLGNFFLGLSCAGVDISEELAYAYMVIDRCVPSSFRIDVDKSYILSEEAHKELVDFMNKKEK